MADHFLGIYFNVVSIMASRNLIVLGIAVLGFLLLMKFKPLTEQGKKPEQNLALKAASGDIQAISKQDHQEFSQRKKRIDRLREQYKEEQRLGVLSEEFPLENGKISVGLRFKPEKQWCQLGELDFIAKRLSVYPQLKLLVSIEDLGERKVLFSQEVGLDVLRSGGIVKASVEQPEKQKTIGLYLCTSRSSRAGCYSKSKAKYDENMTKDYLQGLSSKRIPPSQVFFFQLLFLQNQSLKVPPTLLKDRKYFNSLKGLMNHDNNRNVAKYAFNTSKSLGNFPPEIRKGWLTVKLPYNDPRCNLSR
ncbi:hypothetical protein [Pseudobacteriovorax antillogorgiicola]|uniref:Uncharacterized protein n=1 Tax=Pseudobacteriovorax antillogorgiicola TaxID=1513793 RepID=A0A1Y6CS45_9BACT|nr:hypothetical protein [Pseudobacteriovorax antillogorgiicola]TCS40918.1 hypothetical protein EDD56_1514 [Pseudobacteriovorax antillogorgiicola]SMF83970.1 hypothetical protein SAMN06296036_1514 [Pseudobacteriovorax antillogorgiicola]